MGDRIEIAPILIWFGAGIALILLAELASDSLASIAFTVFALLGYAVAAISLLIAYVRRALNERTKEAWLAVTAIPSLCAVLVVIAPVVSTLATYAEFAAMLPTYSRIVDKVTQSTRPDGGGRTHEARYIVDAGPPVRVAFPKGGIIDNWWGIVYDPTDAVSQATGWRFDGGEQRLTAGSGVRTLFGGDLVSCQHIYGHYYWCSFT